MANEYCSVDDVVAFTGDDDARRNALATIVEAVSRGIDRECRRTFYTVQATRLYDWPDRGYLRLRDDLLSVLSITTNSGQSLDSTDISLRPLGGPPYFEIVPVSGVSFEYDGTPFGAISVTGSWGYQTTVPADIKLAAIIWAAYTYAKADVPALQKVSSGDINFIMTPDEDKPPAPAWARMKKFVKTRIAVASTTGQNVTVL